MAGCGKSGSGCHVIAGRGARVSGSGSTTSPIVIEAYPMYLAVQDSANVDLTLTGTGTEADPYIITAEVSSDVFEDAWEMWSGTQAAYDALGVYDSAVLYAITG